MQITDLRSIVTDVRRLTLQIINGRETVVFETLARDGNKYSLLPLSRFTLQKLKNANVEQNMVQELQSPLAYLSFCARVHYVASRARPYFSNRRDFRVYRKPGVFG